MKKEYVKPSMEMEIIETNGIILQNSTYNHELGSRHYNSNNLWDEEEDGWD